MILVGNKISNSIYEQLLKVNNPTKITKYSERKERDIFITNKYKGKKYLEILDAKKILNPKIYTLTQKILTSKVSPSQELVVF
jgi:hypothetical protein